MIVFSGVSIKASADFLEITKVDGSEMRSFYGDTLSVSYTQNDIAYSTTANYYTTLTNTNFGANVGWNPLGTFSDYDVLIYTIDWSSWSYLVNDIQISGLDTYFPDHYRMGVALTSHDNNITASYNAFALNTNHWSTFQAVTGNYEASSNLIDYYGMLYPPQIQGYSSVCRPIFISGTEGGYFDTVYFNSIKPNSYGSGARSWLYIFCPYVGSSMSNTEPVQTTTTTETSSGGAVTTGDIFVDVNIDLDETNGILGNILSVLSDFVGDILDGLKGLFVPDEDYIENWLDDLIDLFEAKFASSGIDIDPLKNALLDMATYGATTSIRFPGVDLTSCGIPFTIPPRAVELQPFGSPINTYIELSINIAATLAVFNLLFTKIKAILVGERLVEIEGDDE